MKLTKEINEKDWFKIIDESNSNLHLSYNNLEKKSLNISKDAFILSLIETIGDKKKYNLLKEQMDKNIYSEKKENEKHKSYSNRKNNLFPHINIRNYHNMKINNTYGQNDDKETLKNLLKKINKNHLKKLNNQLTHKKVFPKGFNLSQSPYQTTNSSNNFTNYSIEEHNLNKRKNKLERTHYFKYNLNSSLYKIINNVENEEKNIKKKNKEMMMNLNDIFSFENKEKNLTESKKFSSKKIISLKLNIPKKTYSYNIIDQKILKGKTNFFNDAKIKMYETYLRKIHNKDKEIKLISETILLLILTIPSYKSSSFLCKTFHFLPSNTTTFFASLILTLNLVSKPILLYYQNISFFFIKI